MFTVNIDTGQIDHYYSWAVYHCLVLKNGVIVLDLVESKLVILVDKQITKMLEENTYNLGKIEEICPGVIAYHDTKENIVKTYDTNTGILKEYKVPDEIKLLLCFKDM